MTRAFGPGRLFWALGSLGVIFALCPAGSAPAEDNAALFKPDRPVEDLPMDTPARRGKLLGMFYGQLAKAGNEQEAAPVAAAIERLWLHSGSDTVSLLMERSLKAANEKNTALALKLLDAVVALAPDFAEGWNRRAYVYYTTNEHQRAIGDLRRVLALEPNHYKALDGLGQILREMGEKKAALQAFRQLQRVHPNWSSVRQTVDELDREVEGQGI